MLVVGDGEHQKSVGRLEHLIGRDIGMRIAKPRGHHAAGQIVQRLVGKGGRLAVEQRHIDLLPVAGARLVNDRGKDRNRGV